MTKWFYEIFGTTLDRKTDKPKTTYMGLRKTEDERNKFMEELRQKYKTEDEKKKWSFRWKKIEAFLS